MTVNELAEQYRVERAKAAQTETETARKTALSGVLCIQIYALQATARQIGNAADLDDAVEVLPGSADLLIWAAQKARDVAAALREIDTVLGQVQANESRRVEEAPA
jgi:SpoU rRNA methylase family enzyme